MEADSPWNDSAKLVSPFFGCAFSHYHLLLRSAEDSVLEGFEPFEPRCCFSLKWFLLVAGLQNCFSLVLGGGSMMIK